MNKPDGIASIHRLLKSIRGVPLTSEDKIPEPENKPPVSETVPKTAPITAPDKERDDKTSPLSLLKQELEKADILLGQLEQDTDISKLLSPQSSLAESFKPFALTRNADQDRASFTNTSLGLDIGSYSIKAVELGYTPTGYNLLHYALVDIVSPTKQTLKFSQLQKEGIDQALAGLNPEQIRPVISVGGSSIIISQLFIPPIPEHELSSYIRWEAKKLIPLDSQDMELNYQLINNGTESPEMKVLLAAVPRRLLMAHKNLLAQTRLSPALTEIAPLALVHAYRAFGKQTGNDPLITLDIGAETTTLSIYRSSGNLMVYYIPISGNSFTRHIQKQLNMDFWQAEQWKRNAQQGVIELLAPALQQLILEIRKILNEYKTQSLTRKFKQIILSGGGALLSHLDSYLEMELGIEIKLFDPFEKIAIDNKHISRTELTPKASQFTTAIGLAIRGFNQNQKSWKHITQ